MRILTIGALIFFSALLAETMLEPGPLWATSVWEAQEVGARKKKQIKEGKKPNQQKQARQRDRLPPKLGPGIGLGL
jgi:hypothetical protein